MGLDVNKRLFEVSSYLSNICQQMIRHRYAALVYSGQFHYVPLTLICFQALFLSLIPPLPHTDKIKEIKTIQSGIYLKRISANDILSDKYLIFYADAVCCFTINLG